MAKVSYIAVPPDLKGFYDQLVTPVYKTKNSSVRFNGRIIPPRKVVNVTSKSLLPQIREIWASVTTPVKNEWKAAGAAVEYTGWQIFVQEMSYRIKHGIVADPTPSILYSYMVGRMNMAAPAVNFSIVQHHPIKYYRMRKVPGTKSQREPVAIEEALFLPLTVGASYRTNLTPSGSNPYARFYARVTRSYQGLDLTDDVGFDLPFNTNWARQEATLTDVIGHARWYSLYFELNDVYGSLEFDNLLSLHSGSNYARDFRSTNISAGYSDYNYQVPASWAAVAAEDGATWGSVYPTDVWS